MEVSVKCEARHICIRLSGELDHHSAKGLLRRLDQEIEKALPTQLTLDLSGVTFMDSSGIALLIRARQPLFTTGGEERSGMGFTIMESFMNQLVVKSAPGKGTTVTMRKRIASRVPAKR